MVNSFRFRATLLFGLLALAVVAALAFRLGSSMSAQILHDQGEQLETLAQSTGVLFGESLQERMREVQLLAGSPEARRRGIDGAAWQDEIARLAKDRAEYVWIGVTDVNGLVQAASGGMLIGQSVAERPWFKSALTAPYVGDPHPAKLLAKLLPPRPEDDPLRLIDLAVPLRDADGRVIGTLGVHGDWAWAREVIGKLRSERKRNEGVLVYLLDREGQVIHKPRGLSVESELGAGVAPPASPRLMRWSDNQSYLTASAKMVARPDQPDLGWTVLVRQPAAQAMKAVEETQVFVWRAGGTAAVVAMLFAWVVATRFSRPLAAIADAARRIERGELKADIPITTRSSELTQLSTALRGMTQKLLGREKALAEANEQLEARVAERTAALAKANAALEQLALHDGLTGLHNRRAGDLRLAEELVRHQRQSRPLGLLLCDIDHFKRINDVHGHAVGDAVLQAVAQQLRTTVRASDVVTRHGGEEFLVLLPDTDEAGLAAVAEKLRAAVEACAPAPVGRVTMSLGGAVAPGGAVAADELLRRADRALYAAKDAGRNRVRLDAALAEPA